ncbi:class I SAM-dependent methyltransferase [Pedobacter punctiformis]|uniref:Methyltransferase domain-containing protein n=1 Tax=Pedobacter punctiformis TaxID=3004097 RepID=A0ABT4L3D8_9SPHI|nr:class I SAM-dependent methyltransferase [Pedobacter sp. HCMS5-2]MCZ4242435.1 methyltransferase domain-containing protein [Pedobacter sp. HCMS5-2]
MPEIVWDATLYDKQHHFVSDYGADVLQWLAPKANEHILDVGCGTGQLAAQIAASGAIVLGTDASADMIANAKLAHPELTFEVVDGTKLHYSENFDAIFSNATFHWIENQPALVEGLFRSLKSGGRLVAEFGGKGNVKSITNAIASAAQQLGLADQVVNDFWFFPSISAYTTLLESKGFEVEQAWLFDRPTKLIGEEGMYVWINQFARHAFKNLDATQAESIKNLAVEILKPDYFINGEWVADYRRLRIKAWKAKA